MESDLSSERILEQLSEEELHCVLKQLVDHNIPEHEKCPLVQRLRKEDQQHSKTNNNSNSTSALPQSNCNAPSSKVSVKLRSRLHASSKENECGERKLPQSKHVSQSHCRDKPVNYAQSLQELRSNNNCDDSQNLPAAISNSNTEIVTSVSHLRSGGSNRKPNRANSFTMPSQSDNNSNKNDKGTFKVLDHHQLTNGSEVSRETFRVSDKQTVNGNLFMSNRKSSSSAINSCAPQSCSNSSHYLFSDIASDHNHSSYKSISNCTSVHIGNIETLVNRIPISDNNSVSNTRPSATNIEGVGFAPSNPLTFQHEKDDGLHFGEMKILHKNFNYLEYNRDLNLSLKNCDSEDCYNKDIPLKNPKNFDSEQHSVDKILEMTMLNNNRQDNSNTNCQTLSTNSHPPFNFYNENTGNNGDNANNGNIYNNNNYTNNNNNNYNNNNNNNNTTSIREKEKRANKNKKDQTRISEQVEGYVGYITDLDYLESFVNNTSNNIYKKNKAKAQKHENETGKRSKRNNGEIKADKKVISSKVTLSNSSSLSGDEIQVVKNCILLKSNASPELFNSNGTKSKKSKSKNKEKNDKLNQISQNKTESNEHRKDDNNEVNDDNSFSNGSDTEDEQQFCPRSKKSNSLLPTNSITLEEEDNLHTVSDSEMADREKGFVTPKNKYFKKKKIQQSRFQHNENSHISNQKQSSNRTISYNSNGTSFHNLGRGYESEFECSLNNSLNPNSFTTQSLSSSMLAINSKVFDKRPSSNLSPSTKEEATPLQSEPVDLLDHEFMLQLAANDNQDNGPKMPSYADIAKLFHHPPNTGKNVTVNLKQPSVDNSSSPIDEFPQLNLRSPTEIVNNCLSNLKVSPICSYSKQISLKNDSSQEELSKREKLITPNAIQEEPEINDISENSSTLFDSQVNHQIEPESLQNESDVPVVIYGTSDNLNFCDQFSENSVNGNKISFGFFEESEISEIVQEGDFTLDQNFYNIQNLHLQSKHSEDMEINGQDNLSKLEEVNAYENDNFYLVEDFYKNAVHVGVLENQYFQKLNGLCDSVEKQSTKNQEAYSLSTSSPLFTFGSPASSVAASSPPVFSNSTFGPELKSGKPFVSCVSTLSNFKFLDNVDLGSFNYTNVIDFVYKSWEQCNRV